MNKRRARSAYRPQVVAWCSYDWANSGYTTLMITVFAVYMQRFVFPSNDGNATGAIVWAWGVAVSMLVGAILSPIVGAVADAHGSKRFWLALTAFSGGGCCIAMSLVPTPWVWVVTALFLLANLSLELSLTFYNGFLPEIANEKEMNRISAAGMAWGYLGGGIMLLLAMIYLSTDAENAEAAFRLRICIFFTGIWWILFTIPTIWILRDAPRDSIDRAVSVFAAGKNAVKDVAQTLIELRRFPTLALFLIGFLFYNDGLQTVYSQASTFAIRDLSFTDSQLIAVVLMVQFVAIPGAFLVGWLADWIGQKTALLICLFAWIVILGSAWFVVTKPAYWVMAVGVALVLGGTQSISRAVMGNLTPPQHSAKFFGFFNFSGKATSFLGTFVFGLVIATTGSSRLAIVMLLMFFLIGFAIVSRIDFSKRPARTTTTGSDADATHKSGA